MLQEQQASDVQRQQEALSKFGIKETTEMVNFLATLGNVSGKILADGNFSMIEIPKLLPILSALPKAINGASEIGKEVLDLDAKEIKQLSVIFKEKFDIPQDRIEEFTEATFDQALSFFTYVRNYFLKQDEE